MAAGYNLIATASEKSLDYLRGLRASAVFDYKCLTLVDDVVAAINNMDFVGIFQAVRSMESAIQIATRIKDPVFIACSDFPPSHLPSGIEAKVVWALTINDNEVGPVIFRDFLPKALAFGEYATAPEPMVVGRGIQSVQVALQTRAKGVSARKVVVVR